MMLLPLASALLSLHAQSSTFGKSNEQILAMGHTKWVEFYTEKAGGSTAAMVSAEDTFGLAAFARNQSLLAKSSKAKKEIWLSLRKTLTEFRTTSVGIYSPLTGGGTIWHPIAASTQAEVELILFDMISGKGKTAPSRVVSDVQKELTKLKGEISKADLDVIVHTTKKELLSEWARLDQQFRGQIVPIAKKLNRSDSDRVLDFCFHSARLGTEMLGSVMLDSGLPRN